MVETVMMVNQVSIKKYYMCLGSNFHTIRHVYEELTVIPSQKLHNKVAGCVTHLMK
jgi:small subunit ribosomal protein S17e